MVALLQELRARLGNTEKLPAFPYSRLEQGLPRGALVEITGPGKTESVATLLAENPLLRVAWIESHFSLLPSALPQRKVNLEKIFFVEGGRDSAWAASTILRSQLFPIVVYHPAPLPRETENDLRELRRFQLLAEKSASTMILLGEEPRTLAWPIRLSLASENGGKKLNVKRGR